MQCFAASKRIVDDCQSHVEANEGVLPTFGPIRYYSIPLEKKMPRRAYCVDIKAAYPSTMRVEGWIAPDTFDACMKLKKPDRLKCVGMIGSSKFIQEFRNGRITSMRREDHPLRPYFFATCERVGNVMHELAELNGGGFLFYWVDGIFLNTSNPQGAVDYLASKGYRATVEPVEDLRWSDGGKYLLYRKSGKTSYLCVPRRLEYEDAELIRQTRAPLAISRAPF